MKPTTLRAAVGAVLALAVPAVLVPASTASAAPRTGAVDKATAASFGRAADTLLTERTSALLDSVKSPRIATQLDRKVSLAAAAAKTEKAGLATLQARKKRLAGLHEAYTKADTQVTVDGTRSSGGRAVVRLTETTTLTYKKIRGDEPVTTGFKARHEARFTARSGGTWELTALTTDDDGPLAINDPTVRKRVASLGPTPSAPRASTSWTSQSVPKRAKAGVDYQAMAAYTEKYWRNYNPSYRKFNDAGGDCTNFLSQGLKAGGWKPETGSADDYRKWWYSGSGQSDSWVGVNEWSWYALNSKRVTSLANVYQLEVGDVMQMDFDGDGSKDHSMMSTYRSRYGVPYLTYHSTNTYRKSVASIIASYPNAVYYAYRT
ncbi:amidase domain-containing protein [Streptomyces huiliensis]|uniref:amidase domain-containing protein n=1 Tax=Streptomyces huiliensis TaxID=2876027 RepID=UPI001CC181CE|nr:amidase domain-containing protein [Streptomyces huiliensis]MBZ4320954.1 amidase domain-containing protein [Streptomyces huiliensis]